MGMHCPATPMLVIAFALHAVPASAQRLESDPAVTAGPVGDPSDEWSDSRARATTKLAAVPMLLPGGGGVALQGAF